MTSHLGRPGLVMLSCLAMMLRRMLVVFGGFLVMFCTFMLGHFDNILPRLALNVGSELAQSYMKRMRL